jgi:DNA-binding NarL/FixJ family response regulator
MQTSLSQQPITVTVVARLPLQQCGLRTLISSDPELAAGQTVASIDDVMVGPQPRPHVILYYLDETRNGDEDLVSTLISQGMEVVVLVGRTCSVQAGVMVRLGVRGVLASGVNRRELTSAIRHVARGRSYVSPAVASDLLMQPHDSESGRLTLREQEILAQVASGNTDREIARALHIAVHTVRAHLDNIRKKTGQRRRPDLTRYAITNGLWPTSASPIEAESGMRATG